MSKQEERVRQDWGGYQPETQKALRFVASLAGEGTAKQIAEAIAHEYAQREKSKPMNKSTRQETLSEDDIKVLRLFIPAHRNRDYEDFVRWSGLNAERFSECVDTLVKQRYLRGDTFLGYRRTKKPFPKLSEVEWNAAIETIEDPFSRRIVRAIREKVPGWTL